MSMTLREAFEIEYKYLIEHRVKFDRKGHYRTSVDFKGQPFYCHDDGSMVDVYEFRIYTKKKRFVKDRKGKTHIQWINKDKFFFIGDKYTKLSRLLFNYAIFLRCDNIVDKEIMRYYILHLLFKRIEYVNLKTWKWCGKRCKKWVVKDAGGIDYKYLTKMVDRVVKWASKKEITDEMRDKYRHRQYCLVNMEVRTKFGGIRKKTKFERNGDIQRAKGIVNGIKIRNGETEGFCRKTIYNHTKDTKESKKDLIKRLYDPEKSLRVNARDIGVSINTLMKYLPEIKKELEESKVSVKESEDTWLDDILEEDSKFMEIEVKKEDKNTEVSDDDNWLDKLDLDDF